MVFDMTRCSCGIDWCKLNGSKNGAGAHESNFLKQSKACFRRDCPALFFGAGFDEDWTAHTPGGTGNRCSSTRTTAQRWKQR